MSEKVKIILVDDHKIMRDGLRKIIESNSQFEVIGEAVNGREGIKLCTSKNPDVVIMDIAMPDLNGVEATRQILETNPNIRIIALSMHSNKQFVSGMLKAGAYGYLLKDCDSDELITAIQMVIRNQKYIAQEISSLLINEYLFTLTEEETELSSREKEILQLITEGKSSKEIAEVLFISFKTVDAHRKNIMDKLNLRTLPELTKYAIKSGLTTLDD
ncbi:MAG: response regulator transcription factor [Lutibacter sp.]|uniref:response regulator n=1 Tax=Lutibacter sp. TaxID=1925666 RepID=UPI0017BC9E55|nr:response regulator transcription factor [Lutibacter sp.]MBT8318324.1 response regulator transcription factor [Lutibacter sp.]NNJ59182.1 response regulator transcription factor [Lutibacter sp.]